MLYFDLASKKKKKNQLFAEWRNEIRIFEDLWYNNTITWFYFLLCIFFSQLPFNLIKK